VRRSLPSGVRGLARRAALAWRWARGTAPLRTLAFADPAMQARITALLRAESFDLLQVEDTAMGAYDYPGGTPGVFTEHEARTDAVRDRGIGGALEAGRWRRFQPAVWRRFDHVQVFTARDAAAVRALAPELADRVSVNPFGVHLPQGRPRHEEEPDTLVFVGGFLHPPNVDAAEWLTRDIMPRLWARRPGLRLQLVGSYPPRHVRALASDRVVVTGRVPEVEPYLERATVVLAPLRTGGGMRVKVLQGMAFGRAVVTTPLGAEGLVPWVEGEAPCAVADGPDGVAEAVACLLADEPARRAMGARARAYVARHHSWEAYGARLEDIYRRVLGTRRAPAASG
jgi:polysaccharide biosynthesis protein PslH